MKLIIKIVIPFAFPSANVWKRTHWRIQGRVRGVWRGYLLSGDPTVWTVVDKKRKLVITRVGSRLLDPDNLWGFPKDCITDNLKCIQRKKIGGKFVKVTRRGLIYDDNPDWLDIETTQRKKAKGEMAHTIVEVWE